MKSFWRKLGWGLLVSLGLAMLSPGLSWAQGKGFGGRGQGPHNQATVMAPAAGPRWQGQQGASQGQGQLDRQRLRLRDGSCLQQTPAAGLGTRR